MEWQPGDIGITNGASLIPANLWKVQAVEGDLLQVLFYEEEPDGGHSGFRHLRGRKASEARKVTAAELAELGVDPNSPNPDDLGIDPGTL